jgi:endonuclease/exonuclease/phosphatase family metal-dependent hydrolase
MHPEKEKDAILETLNKVLEMISNKNEIFLMGDFNVRVGKEEYDQVVSWFGEEELDNS